MKCGSHLVRCGSNLMRCGNHIMKIRDISAKPRKDLKVIQLFVIVSIDLEITNRDYVKTMLLIKRNCCNMIVQILRKLYVLYYILQIAADYFCNIRWCSLVALQLVHHSTDPRYM